MATASAITFTEADLHAAAGDQSFERGLSYTEAVYALAALGTHVTAAVRGAQDYQVLLTLNESGGIRGECDCPHGQEGFFCKHCVAVGLTILRSGSARSALVVPAQRSTTLLAAGGGADRASAARASDGTEDAGDAEGGCGAEVGAVNAWLDSRGRDDLLLLIHEHLLEDDEWRHRLELRAAGAAADLSLIAASIDDLLDGGDLGPYGYLEGADCWRYARRVREVAESVRALIDGGDASGAVAVAEYALATIRDACGEARDRAGVIGDAAADLVASHRAACTAAPPAPAGLADFLAGNLLRGQEVPLIDFDDYADLLGPQGLARLRESVVAAWEANPGGWPEREAMERVLRAAGDVDGLVRLFSADLDECGFAHQRIASELERAGRAAEALGWAERGLAEASRPDVGLAEFVVQRYWAAGRLSDALAVCRDWFTHASNVSSYRQLRAAAELTGTWPQTREWALDLLRGEAKAAAGRHFGWAPEPVLIDVLIDEGEVAEAWRSAAGIASEAQWLRLADLVAETRPADALAVYLRQIEPLGQRTGDGTYERMAQLLTSARACHDRLGTARSFDVYLRALRDDQKRKRKLIRILDAHQLR